MTERPDATEPATYPALLGVVCDGLNPGTNKYDEHECEARIEADFLVSENDTRGTRLGYVLDHATTLGWAVIGRDLPEFALTFCPAHASQASTGADTAAEPTS